MLLFGGTEHEPRASCMPWGHLSLSCSPALFKVFKYKPRIVQTLCLPTLIKVSLSPQQKSHFISCHSPSPLSVQALEIMKLLFIYMDLPILDISYSWDYVIRG